MFSIINFSADITYSISKFLNNTDRSHFFRTCKKLNNYRNREKFQILFCQTVGCNEPFKEENWSSSYFWMKENYQFFQNHRRCFIAFPKILMSQSIKYSFLEKKDSMTSLQLHPFTIGDYIRSVKIINNKECFKIYEFGDDVYYSCADIPIIHTSKESGKIIGLSAGNDQVDKDKPIDNNLVTKINRLRGMCILKDSSNQGGDIGLTFKSLKKHCAIHLWNLSNYSHIKTFLINKKIDGISTDQSIIIVTELVTGIEKNNFSISFE